jgi:hypothetical protein
VFNLFGERESVVPPGRQPDVRPAAPPVSEPGIDSAEAAEEESAVDLG